MESVSSSEAYSRSAGRQIPAIYWSRRFITLYTTTEHQSVPAPDDVLSTLAFIFFKIRFNITFKSTPQGYYSVYFC